MDPSLNSRPGLAVLLEKIAGLNQWRKIPLISEIRAESVDKTMAELFQRAGFAGFEVGLQSTNPVALRQMNRPTDLKAFLIMIDASLPLDVLWEWQDRVFIHHGDVLPINFAHINLQIRWMELTVHERYSIPVLKSRGK